MTMTPDAFDALATLMSLRHGNRSYAACRLVLVEGMTNADAMRATGLARASVTKAVRQCDRAMELVLRAAGGPSGPAGPAALRSLQALETPPVAPRPPPLVSLILWEKIEHMVTRPEPARTNATRADDRDILNGILYVLLHRIDFKDLPKEQGFGHGATCQRRLGLWRRDGTWERLQEALRERMPTYPLIDWERVSKAEQMRMRGESLACAQERKAE